MNHFYQFTSRICSILRVPCLALLTSFALATNCYSARKFSKGDKVQLAFSSRNLSGFGVKYGVVIDVLAGDRAQVCWKSVVDGSLTQRGRDVEFISQDALDPLGARVVTYFEQSSRVVGFARLLDRTEENTFLLQHFHPSNVVFSFPQKGGNRIMSLSGDHPPPQELEEPQCVIQ